jgi:hypothetical protein
LKAKVNPSQRLSEKPHEPWVAVEKKSGSLSQHTTFMAGKLCLTTAKMICQVTHRNVELELYELEQQKTIYPFVVTLGTVFDRKSGSPNERPWGG